MSKKYSIEQLEKLHEKYRNMGNCDGYCPECGINLFFDWLKDMEDVENITSEYYAHSGEHEQEE